ncbi:hypothetical protein [Paenibacillus beijingensis]|uniref:hypothetical protein n=1 Tax=Paenibacillus beijingensis TaxID=1126833 RepID=UPI000B02BC5C|nr:hypothetical protein [Paenibacillus beijingensis]
MDERNNPQPNKEIGTIVKFSVGILAAYLTSQMMMKLLDLSMWFYELGYSLGKIN